MEDADIRKVALAKSVEYSLYYSVVHICIGVDFLFTQIIPDTDAYNEHIYESDICESFKNRTCTFDYVDNIIKQNTFKKQSKYSSNDLIYL